MLIPDNVRAKVLKQEKGNTTAMDESDVKYLVFDIESVPDAKLIKKVKYPDQVIDDEAAVRKFQEEVLALTSGATTFIPVTFQYPLCICIAKVRSDFTIADIVSLDEPKFRPSEMTDLFWRGVEKQYGNAALVTFNGRGFDVPLMELMAFRYGITAQRHLKDKFGSRYRFGTKHIDLHDWLSNFNAIRMTGGLNLLAKVLGKPGKMETKGDEVYDLYLKGEMAQINDYCYHDVLDTYFVFLRTRVMLGELSITREQELVKTAKSFIEEKSSSVEALKLYLENWGDWDPWP
ncbi:MAG TPA: 3'-5' exonuclease [Spirochaetota bacterium]|nr:3'-5' exonuclease [Spirochaetota bacterium]